MNKRTSFPIQRYHCHQMMVARRSLVEECPVRLTVNGRDLATLVASPHQLNFLLMGFLRVQGFIDNREQIQSLGVCREFGVARVQISAELPETLRPTVTTGCGGGISYDLNLPQDSQSSGLFSVPALLSLMKQLQRGAELYAEHGGIHSAAIGRVDGRLLLMTEDIGRHNTIDRLAGEALFHNLDLTGTMLVTSGRISSEMVTKAARLGIGLIASRTTPTDQAVSLCQKAGLVLVGYLRGGRFEVYSHAERLRAASDQRIGGVTGVILAGGESRRMGSDKSLLPIHGARFIDHTYRCLSELFDEVIIVTNSPSLYDGIPCSKVPDIYYAQGSLAGIHSGLCHARHERVFVVACDMPFVDSAVVRHICSRANEGDVVIPVGERGSEPLHALYSKGCLPAMEEVLDAGRKRIVEFFPQVEVVEIGAREWSAIDPGGRSFCNINTPQEYFQLHEDGRENQTKTVLQLSVNKKRA